MRNEYRVVLHTFAGDYPLYELEDNQTWFDVCDNTYVNGVTCFDDSITFGATLEELREDLNAIVAAMDKPYMVQRRDENGIVRVYEQ